MNEHVESREKLTRSKSQVELELKNKLKSTLEELQKSYEERHQVTLEKQDISLQLSKLTEKYHALKKEV